MYPINSDLEMAWLTASVQVKSYTVHKKNTGSLEKCKDPV